MIFGLDDCVKDGAWVWGVFFNTRNAHEGSLKWHVGWGVMQRFAVQFADCIDGLATRYGNG
jgi:hypothetical protein